MVLLKAIKARGNGAWGIHSSPPWFSLASTQRKGEWDAPASQPARWHITSGGNRISRGDPRGLILILQGGKGSNIAEKHGGPIQREAECLNSTELRIFG